MLDEEEKLHQQTVKEDEQIMSKMRDEWEHTLQEQQYRRLDHLLSRSNFYSQYLMDKMDQQTCQKQTQEHKRKEREQNKAILVEKNQTILDIGAAGEGKKDLSPRRSGRTKSQCSNSQGSTTASSSQDAQDPAGKKKKRGRKRKAASGQSSDNTQYFSSPENQRQKRSKLDVGSKEVPGVEVRVSNHLATKETHEEVESTSATARPSGVHSQQPTLVTGGVMRQYQLEGFEWLKLLYENGVNGILADEMGLGKTLQCISLIAHLVSMGVSGPFLIIAPLSTLSNWLAEFRRFAPSVPVQLYHGTPAERETMRRRIRSRASEHRVFPCVITSYEIVMNDRRHLQTFMWRYLVIDEGHRIKNLNCRLIRALKQLESVNRLLLTGTPLQNNLSELWSLLNFLLPEIFDDLNIFESWFDFSSLSGSGANEKIIAQEREKNVLAKLHQILTPFLLRRLKQDVELCIPPKKELQVFAPLTATQQTFYAATLNHTITQMLDARNETQEPKAEVELSEKGRPVRKSAKKVNYDLMLEGSERGGRDDDDNESDAHLDDWVMRIAKCTESRYSSASCGAGKQRQAAVTAEVNLTLRNAMMQLRKICNHPYLVEYPLDVATGQYRIDEDVVRSCGKMMLLDKILPRLRAAGHKMLIFSQMTRMLDILQDYCYLRKLSFSRLDGSMAHQLRAEQIQQFQEDSGVSVFLLSTRAGGLGINLVAADTVIIYDSDWNPQSDLQAQDRCHRIGQTKPVVIFRFVTADTIDEKIVERAAAKRKLEKIVMHKGKFKGAGNKNFKDSMAELDPRDLLAILKSTDHTKSIKNDSLDISDNDLALLLDRSDLLMYQDARVQPLDAATSGDTVKADTNTSTLFKVIDEEEGETELKMESSETC